MQGAHKVHCRRSLLENLVIETLGIKLEDKEANHTNMSAAEFQLAEVANQIDVQEVKCRFPGTSMCAYMHACVHVLVRACVCVSGGGGHGKN